MILPVVKKKYGQGLIELVIALGIAAFIIVALVQTMVTGAKNTRFAKNQSLATRYAQQTIEKIRNLRDTLGWALFFNTYNGTRMCVGEGVPETWTETIPCPVNVENIFSRAVVFDDSGDPGNTLTVSVTATWIDNDGTHKSEQNTELTRW